MSYYLGLANSPTGLRGCLLQEAPTYLEPRPLYLNLTGGPTLEAPLHHTLDILECTPRLAWATSRPPDPPSYHPDAQLWRQQVQGLELPPKEVDTILRLADRIQGRPFHRAHLAAWLALRDSQGEWLGRAPEDMAWDWLQHLARVRTDTPF